MNCTQTQFRRCATRKEPPFKRQAERVLPDLGGIAWYVRSILQSAKMSLFIASLLVVLYGFIFTLIQLQDYALLMGSIGLFLTLACVMYFSRKIKWN